MRLKVACAAAFATACSGDDAPPRVHPCVTADLPKLADDPPSYSTASVDVTTELDVCQGTLDLLDGRVSALSDVLRLEVTRRIPLILNASGGESCEGDDTYFGCARANGEVVAIPSTVFHELAHGVACEFGRSDRIYEEGYATAFDGGDLFAGPDALPPPTASAGSNTVDYLASAFFVRWLYEQHGGAALAEAYDRTLLNDGATRFEQQFELAFGETVTVAEPRFVADRPFFYPAAWDPCVGPVVPWNDDGLHIDTSVDCSSPTTFGPYLEGQLVAMSSQSMYAVFTVEGRDDDQYLLQLDGNEGAWMLGDPVLDWGVRVVECHATPITDLAEAEQTEEARLPSRGIVYNQNTGGFEFRPGRRYRVELIAPSSASARRLRASFVRQTDAPAACEPPVPEASCDPRMPTTCADGETCSLQSCTFACQAGAGNRESGAACSGSGVVGECAPELTCVPASLLIDCDGAACCTAYCDTDAPACPASLGCVPVFAEDAAPIPLETLGVCIDA